MVTVGEEGVGGDTRCVMWGYTANSQQYLGCSDVNMYYNVHYLERSTIAHLVNNWAQAYLLNSSNRRRSTSGN